MNQAGMTGRFSTCIFFLIFIIGIFSPNLSTAAIEISEDVVSPPYEDVDPWFIHLDPDIDDLIIGNTANGGMEITNSSWVQNVNGYIGMNPTASGLVTVTGQSPPLFGSRWYSNEYLYVAYSGTGVLEVSDGGHVSSLEGLIGTEPGSSGSVTVTGQNSLTELNSLWESNNIYVGVEGKGEMVISDGGNVRISSLSFIGYQPGSVGDVNVTGAGSLWQTTGGLYIGGGEVRPGGTGLLNIDSGGTVEAGSVRIWPTGTLSGEGRLVSDSVLNSGTIKPGNSIGTLTIEGNLAMRPDGIYEVDVDNSGNSDLLSVTGDLDILGGTVQAVSAETVTGVKQYTIIEAGNITGSFDAVDTALIDCTILVSDDVSLDYGTDSVLMQINVRPFDDPGIVKTRNQLAVARVFQQIDDGGNNPVTTALQSLESLGHVRNAYDQLCGQTRLNLAPVTAVDTSKFMGTISDRLNYANQGFSYYGFSDGPLLAMAEPAKSDAYSRMYYTSPYSTIGRDTTNLGYDEEWVFWGKGYGALGDRETQNGVPGYQYVIVGTSFGLDFPIADSSLLGFTAGFSKSYIDSSLEGNESDISNTHIGIYGNHNTDYWHFDSIFAYSFLKYKTERDMDLVSEKLKGDSDGKGISGYVEARYDLGNIDNWLLQPMAAFQFSSLALDGYTESGGDSSLGYDDQSYNSYKGSLGVKLTQEVLTRYSYHREYIQLRGRWIHEFGDVDSSIDAHFASDPGVVFKVSDEGVAKDTVVLGFGFNTDLSLYSRFSLGYDVFLNNDDNMHLLSAMIVYRW